MAFIDLISLDFSSMRSQTVWFCALANISNVFAVTFMILYLTFCQYLAAEQCFYITSIFLVGAVAAVVILRRRQLSSSRLETFMLPVRKGVVAHRGGATEAPENTLRALREAKKNGASSVEIDLEMSKDGVAILLHDETVDRTTDGTGQIKDMMYEDVRKLNASAKFGQRSDSYFEQIPTVEEAVLLCSNLDMNIFFDVKNYSQEMCTFIADLYKRYPHLYDSCMVCSFHPQVIYMLRRSDNKILTALTTQPDFLADTYTRVCKSPSTLGYLFASVLDFGLVWSLYSWLWFFVGNSAVLLKHTTVSKDIVKFWQERDIAVVTWTVNSPEAKDHFVKDLEVPVMTDVIRRSK